MKIVSMGVLIAMIVLSGFSAIAAEGPVEKFVAKNIDSIETNCANELATYCRTVTPGEGRGLACIYAHNDKLSKQCETALYNSSAEFETAAKNLDAFANDCMGDMEKFCSKVAVGEGRVLECLKKNEKMVSADCKEVMPKVEGDLGKEKNIDYQYHSASIQ